MDEAIKALWALVSDHALSHKDREAIFRLMLPAIEGKYLLQAGIDPSGRSIQLWIETLRQWGELTVVSLWVAANGRTSVAYESPGVNFTDVLSALVTYTAEMRGFCRRE